MLFHVRAAGLSFRFDTWRKPCRGFNIELWQGVRRCIFSLKVELKVKARWMSDGIPF